jgi:hypothetical protein
MEPATPFTDIIIADTQLLIIEGLKAVLAGKYNITDVAGSKNELDSKANFKNEPLKYKRLG